MIRALFLTALVSLVLVASARAADVAKPAPSAAAEPLVVTIGDRDAEVVGPVAVGRKIEVRVDFNESIPVQWGFLEIIGDGVKTAGESKRVAAEAGPAMAGRSIVTLIVPLEAVKAGKAVVMFAYGTMNAKGRPEGKGIQRTVAVTIHVQAVADAAKPVLETKAKKPEKAPAGAADAPAAPPAKRVNPVPINGKGDPLAPGFVVLLEDKIDGKDVVAADKVSRLERLYGFAHKYIYNMQGFKGFAAMMSNETAEKLRWEPAVHSIERNGAVHADAAGGAGAN